MLSHTKELVPTTTRQLAHLPEHDPDLAPYFARVLASNCLPDHPVRDLSQGYIVNVDKQE